MTAQHRERQNLCARDMLTRAQGAPMPIRAALPSSGPHFRVVQSMNSAMAAFSVGRRGCTVGLRRLAGRHVLGGYLSRHLPSGLRR